MNRIIAQRLNDVFSLPDQGTGAQQINHLQNHSHNKVFGERRAATDIDKQIIKKVDPQGQDQCVTGNFHVLSGVGVIGMGNDVLIISAEVFVPGANRLQL
ncbi:hypothetical protein L1281_001062 [Neisseria sp. HSC-16F19]|nr:hypothetical protein [Neisseria sp. HSC-16F19]MCP2040479.1 hypothetical protein [Neisseria sp. HSC-16F19]